MEIRLEGVDTERFDECLRALAKPACRNLVQYFERSELEETSVHALAEEMGDTMSVDPEDAVVRFHHSVLPTLDAVGLVDYDYETGIVEYRGADLPDALHELLVEAG